MFDVGFWEIIILFGLGLVILGPERLPKVAMQVGNWAGQARRMARTLTSQMRDELDIDINQPFSGSAKPNPPYSRPGMDDLNPESSATFDEPPVDEQSDDAQSDDAQSDDAQADEETGDRDHSDAGAETDDDTQPEDGAASAAKPS
jgi:sec-independent protein translocase protein TatB